MRLRIFISVLQAEDFAKTIAIGEHISIELLGSEGSTVGIEVPALPLYLDSSGKRTLRTIGIAEYAFCGRIEEVRTLPGYGISDLVYSEVLVDCGLPVVFIRNGDRGISPHDLQNPTKPDFSVGRFLSGLMILHGRISFRHPGLIMKEMKMKIRGIDQLDLSPSSDAFAELRPVQAIDLSKVRQPLVLEVEY